MERTLPSLAGRGKFGGKGGNFPGNEEIDYPPV